MIDYVKNISDSNKSIYDYINSDDKKLYIPSNALQSILSKSIIGLNLNGYPLRTRSKVLKQAICTALGYPIPKSFKKTHPRFPGQNFDEYAQKRDNVQIWNEPIDSKRRYVFFRLDDNDIVTKVKIITGKELATFDHTGTLTQKYQATAHEYDKNICSNDDTNNLKTWITTNSSTDLSSSKPNDDPKPDETLHIKDVYSRLLPLVGKTVSYVDATHDRTRGDELHSLICEHLGYRCFEDDGSYPDLRNQLLEVKLQTSPTIDLGLHSPNDGEIIFFNGKKNFYSKDVRYVVFKGSVESDKVKLLNIYLVSGEEFFHYFPPFGGLHVNKKLQMLLPTDFFD
ncbi:MAG: restriction endonuclease [Lactobacillus sp.]|nr:MAG: restriction endonuclease [Lactobacillus sp.]